MIDNSASMRIEDFSELVLLAFANRTTGTGRRNKDIPKYIHPNIDMRDGRIFSVTVVPWFTDQITIDEKSCREQGTTILQKLSDQLGLSI